MTLSRILDGVNPIKNTVLNNLTITGITCDSRQVSSGCIFVCQKGLKFDGHDHAKQAIENGASVIVCQKELDVPNQIVVADTRYAYGVMCQNFFDNPAKKLKLVGITGTNGKTTTTNIIKHILTECGNKVGLMGTIQNEIDDVVLPAKHTTPDAYALASMQDKMVRAGCNYAVMEVSSHALDQHRLASCFFEAGAFTNLTQDHLEYHNTMQNYFEAKKKLFDISENKIINLDDDYGKKIIEKLGEKAITFSMKDKNADFFADNIKIKADGSHFDLIAKGQKYKIDFCMPGYFSVANALTAAATCESLGIDLAKIAHALKTCEGVTGRTEVIKANTEFSIIRDYAHTPDGLLKIISSVREFADDNRIVVLFGCAGNRDRTKRKIMAEIVSRLSDFCILTSDNPRDEDVLRIIDDAKDGLLEHTTPYKIIPDRFEAIKWALENCKKGDILILAGKGHEDYQVLDYGTIYFDEKEIVQRLTGYKQ